MIFKKRQLICAIIILAVSAQQWYFPLELKHGIGTANLENITHHQSNGNTSAFDQHWPDIKEHICPDLRPTNVGASLFELARIELGLTASQSNDDTVFFRFNAGGVGVAASDRQHALAYLRVYKGGNNHIRQNLRVQASTSRIRNKSHVWEFDHIADLFSRVSRSHARTNRTCIITAVRDPVEHFLSGYNELMFRRAGYKNSSVGAFEQFVRDFIGGPTNSGEHSSRMEAMAIAHVYSMSGILWGMKMLQECHGNKAPSFTAYLPSLRDLDTEFPRMIQEHCAGLPVFDAFGTKYVHKSQADPYHLHASAKIAWEAGGVTARALCAIHALDYACFDSIPVPSICQSVYGQVRVQGERSGPGALNNKPLVETSSVRHPLTELQRLFLTGLAATKGSLQAHREMYTIPYIDQLCTSGRLRQST